jgi:hypothetical protein
MLIVKGMDNFSERKRKFRRLIEQKKPNFISEYVMQIYTSRIMFMVEENER